MKYVVMDQTSLFFHLLWTKKYDIQPITIPISAFFLNLETSYKYNCMKTKDYREKCNIELKIYGLRLNLYKGIKFQC